MALCIKKLHHLPSLCDVATLYDAFCQRNSEAMCIRLMHVIDQYARQTTTKRKKSNDECEVECPHCGGLFDVTLESVAELTTNNRLLESSDITVHGELI